MNKWIGHGLAKLYLRVAIDIQVYPCLCISTRPMNTVPVCADAGKATEGAHTNAALVKQQTGSRARRLYSASCLKLNCGDGVRGRAPPTRMGSAHKVRRHTAVGVDSTRLELRQLRQ